MKGLAKRPLGWYVTGYEAITYRHRRPLHMEAYTNETYFDEFVAACEQFEKLLGELRSESARVLEHGVWGTAEPGWRVFSPWMRR
jgi:hypothetical protein